MSFLHPERLALLLVVVGLVLAYVLVQRRRRAAVAAYTNPALHDRLAPNRTSGWKRHLSIGMALAGIAILVVAIAQPTMMRQVPRERGVVVMALDVSASMSAEDIAPNRLQAAIEGAKGFVDELPDGIEIGVVAFDANATTVLAPTDDHEAATKAIESLQLGQSTAAGEGIYASLDSIKTTLDRIGSEDVPATVVLLSDGATTTGRPVTAAAQAAKDAKVPVTTIAYGTPNGTVTIDGEVLAVPADPDAMEQVAQITGGGFFQATTAGQLQAAYEDIKTNIGYISEPHEVTTVWMGGALLVVLAAAATGIVISSRPI